MKYYVVSNENKWATGGLSRDEAAAACARLNNGERLKGEIIYPGSATYPDEMAKARPYRVISGDYSPQYRALNRAPAN